jgi:hypothetical protein
VNRYRSAMLTVACALAVAMSAAPLAAVSYTCTGIMRTGTGTNCHYEGCSISSSHHGTFFSDYTYTGGLTEFQCASCGEQARLEASLPTTYVGTGSCASNSAAEACANAYCGAGCPTNYCTWIRSGCGGGTNCYGGDQACETPGYMGPHINGAGGGNEPLPESLTVGREPVMIELRPRGARWSVILMRLGPDVGAPMITGDSLEADLGYFAATPPKRKQARWPAHVKRMAVLARLLSGGATVERNERVTSQSSPPFLTLDPVGPREVPILGAGGWLWKRRAVVPITMKGNDNAIMYAGQYSLLLYGQEPATFDRIEEAANRSGVEVRVLE